MQSSQTKVQRGFTLIEVLIAFIILSFGLLGAVALQAKAKQASFDSMQRAAAVALGTDIVQRIRANDTITSIKLYGSYNGDKAIKSDSKETESSACFASDSECDTEQIVSLDVAQWKRAISARSTEDKYSTGSLDDATVCISQTSAANTGGKGFNIEVVISWQGRQEFKANTDTGKVACGDKANNKRRLVVLTSYIYVRS
ncbi:pilus assembly protein [Pseudoalteromonas distincta]|uniref:Type IV pilus modification protein PilV n=1 Tax=Pseudoalteromonas distincta TaxID=77608 RepID=A0ABT9GHV2_9GAMM|nr:MULTISPECIES: type IV pilus modification protein PilV [Pseudoalteromonas]KHM44427.1 pilus assembly protein [Pseudoalteromonas elyakovii]KID39744.1 pilus assembly protein [Pseudoalteromonas distincta]MCK8102079.1 type IV pilus modification protein PilV [Pseudoalteromonas sp. 2CM36K]MDP4485463.1 type IV pilus modification protein PilV [Pseudoalteromonas elyakovii]